MGTNGLKWAGDDPEDDCVMLWSQAFGVTSVGRAVIASATVFLMALLAQYLTTRSGNKIQEAKEFAKRSRMAPLSFSSQYYDSEQGRRSNGTNGVDGNGASAHKASTLLQQNGDNSNSAVPATVTSVSTSSRSIPAPAAIRTTMALPASTLFSTNSNGNGSPAPPRLSSSSAPLSNVNAAAKVSDYEHFCDSLQHGLRIFIAYLLMLAAMTYDVTLIASIVLGFTLGYFIFTNDTSKVPISADPCCS
ncbi:Ctr copper transporter [Globisporangium polare]